MRTVTRPKAVRTRPAKSPKLPAKPAAPLPLPLSGSGAVDELRIVEDYLSVLGMSLRSFEKVLEPEDLESLSMFVWQTTRHVKMVRAHLAGVTP